MLDLDFDTESYLRNAEGYFLTRKTMMWYWEQYLQSPEDKENPYAVPLRAEDLSGLPPALLLAGEYDPLLSETEAYAARLQAAGVSGHLHPLPRRKPQLLQHAAQRGHRRAGHVGDH